MRNQVPCPRCGKMIGDDVVAHSDCTPGEQAQPDPRIVPPPEQAMFEEHWRVLIEAQSIHIERTPERGELWLDDGRDKMVDCAYDKVLRIKHQMNQALVFNEDDALDAINYLAFAIRCNRRGRIEREVWDEDDTLPPSALDRDP
jgi:hypothetical protein